MTYKYYYQGIEGALDAQRMLTMFPELKLCIKSEGDFRVITEMGVNYRSFNNLANTTIGIVAYGKYYGDSTKYLPFSKENWEDLKIYVAQKSETFFDVKDKDYVRFTNIKGDIFEGTLDIIRKDNDTDLCFSDGFFNYNLNTVRDKLIILKRNGIKFYYPKTS